MVSPIDIVTEPFDLDTATYSNIIKAAIVKLDNGSPNLLTGITPILFNPSQISTQNSVKRAEQPQAGGTGQKPTVQPLYPELSTLSMELLFDTTNEKVPVTVLTDRIEELMIREGKTHKNPTCMFFWGAFMSFKGHLVSADTTFTMFLPMGIPVRAKMSVTFKETSKWALRGDPLQSADRTTVWRATEGDSLWSIASEEYGDPTKWRPIAAANGIENPRMLRPGTELVVPALDPGEP